MFLVKIEGQGGHAPHATVDPIVAASCTILVLQQLISRETDPIQSQVLYVTYLRGGTALNVVPSYVEFGGTLRSLTTQGLKQLQKRLKAVHTITLRSHVVSSIFNLQSIDNKWRLSKDRKLYTDVRHTLT